MCYKSFFGSQIYFCYFFFVYVMWPRSTCPSVKPSRRSRAARPQLITRLKMMHERGYPCFTPWATLMGTKNLPPTRSLVFEAA